MVKPNSFSFILLILVGGFLLIAVHGSSLFPDITTQWQIAKPPPERADVDAVPLFVANSVFHDSCVSRHFPRSG
jgi:hypothetical protein